jgi:(S)-2-hydroxyglutarate dehydrogenase
MHRTDVAIIGAGLIGLATARELLRRRPGLSVTVLDKEARVAAHQSSHNSGVIHQGVYYAPGSLKARLCVEGSRRMDAFCVEHGIGVARVGKLIIARSDAELPALAELAKRGEANGVRDLRSISAGEIAELEPNAVGAAALHSPHTSVVDFASVAAALAADIVGAGAEIALGREVLRIRRGPGSTLLETSAGEIEARSVIGCAGLQSDRVAAMTDPDEMRRLRIVPFRGDYFELRPERRELCRGLIYPVPDPRYPFLGVHFTRRHDGAVWAGPNAVLALAREGYGRASFNGRSVAELVTFPGFWRMAARHWRMGIGEMWRDLAKGAFVRSLQDYVPAVQSSDLVAGPSGVRAQAISRDGALVDDFVVSATPGAIHVRNAPSPAATSSLSIASLIADRAEETFELASAG